MDESEQILTLCWLELNDNVVVEHGLQGNLGVVSAVIVQHQVNGNVGELGNECLAHHGNERSEVALVGTLRDVVDAVTQARPYRSINS